MDKTIQTCSINTEGLPKPIKIVKKTLKELIAEKRKQVEYSQNLSNNLEIMDPYENVNRYKNYEEKKTGFIEVGSVDHFCLWDKSYPELPGRVSRPRERLNELGLIKHCEVVDPEVFTDDLFLSKHTSELLDHLKNSATLSHDEFPEFSSKWDSVYFNEATYEAAKLSCEAAVTLTAKVAKGELKNGFALIRPPGHHAMTNDFCGYCYFNNVAIAADRMISQGLAKKILIVDYDVHHGQGTQRMFYDRDDVLYFSIHRWENGEFWPNLRESDSDYIGEGKGKGYNINIPLNETGMEDIDYLAIVLNILLPVAYEFCPDLILVSAGYDAAIGCPEGEMKISPHFYGQLMSLLSGLANGRIVVCLEGGYFLESLAESVACTLKALMGYTPHPINPDSNLTVHKSLQEVINNTKYFLRDYWECFRNEATFNYPKQAPLEDRLKYDEGGEHVPCLSYTFIDVYKPVFELTDFYPIQTEKQIQEFKDIVENYRKEYSKRNEGNKTIGFVYDDLLLKHKPTQDTGKTPPERPERLVEIMNSLDIFGLRNRCKPIQPSKIDVKYWLSKVHAQTYLDRVLRRDDLEEKPDWYHNEHTVDCIEKCVSCVLSLARSIDEGEVKAGVAVVRPPGHHAAHDNGSGFCFVNNAVVAAEYLTKAKNYKRILIIDFDIHHGDGTQNLTYDRSDVMYISVHRYDDAKFFPKNQEANFSYTGNNAGRGYNVNIPFNKGNKSDVDYWMIWHRIVLPLSYSYNPDFVIVSAGFDAGIHDPLGSGYKVTPEMFGHLVNTIKSLASGKLLLLLEGGYHVETTALSMAMCVKAILGDPLPTVKLSEKFNEDTMTTIYNVVGAHKAKWPILCLNKKLSNFSCTSEQRRQLEELVGNGKGDFETEKKFEEIIEKCKAP